MQDKQNQCRHCKKLIFEMNGWRHRDERYSRYCTDAPDSPVAEPAFETGTQAQLSCVPGAHNDAD